MANPIICMKLIEKTNDYVIYEYGSHFEKLDGRLKLSIKNPRKDYEFLTESSIGHMDSLKAHSKLARTIEKGEIPEEICRVS